MDIERINPREWNSSAVVHGTWFIYPALLPTTSPCR